VTLLVGNPSRKTPAAAPGRSASTQVLYIVQVRVVGTRQAAASLAAELQRAGLRPYVVRAGPGFAVRLGAFRERTNADRVRTQARARGVTTTVLRVQQ
jgi:cell division septation protein DedD